MILSFGNDHAGFSLREPILKALAELGVRVIDHGTASTAPVDFPDIAAAVGGDVSDKRAERGLLIGGTGVGASMAANKIPGVRAAVIHDCHCAHQGVEHDDMNVICIGAQIIGPWLALDILRAFLAARFDGSADHVRRVEQLARLERSSAELLLGMGR
jgi:ribose 5-phosphate isomerase B